MKISSRVHIPSRLGIYSKILRGEFTLTQDWNLSYRRQVSLQKIFLRQNPSIDWWGGKRISTILWNEVGVWKFLFGRELMGKGRRVKFWRGGVKVCRDVIINFTSQLLFDLLVMWRPKDVESVVTFHLILLA